MPLSVPAFNPVHSEILDDLARAMLQRHLQLCLEKRLRNDLDEYLSSFRETERGSLRVIAVVGAGASTPVFYRGGDVSKRLRDQFGTRDPGYDAEIRRLRSVYDYEEDALETVLFALSRTPEGQRSIQQRLAEIYTGTRVVGPVCGDLPDRTRSLSPLTRDYAESPQQEPGSDQRFASKIRPTRHDLARGIMEEDADLRAQRPVGACESGQSGPHAHLRASAGRGAGGGVLVCGRHQRAAGPVPAALRSFDKKNEHKLHRFGSSGPSFG